MSKITNPITEASVSCGFYNSLGDRKYDATQMSSIFSGIIRDGIFASIGDCLVVKADSGNVVSVGVGKAWFNNTWTQNDSLLYIDCGIADSVYGRIDAIVLEINSSPSVRDNFIKVIHGIPSSAPVKPELVHTSYIHQYALAYITRPADYEGANSIVAADIENAVGTKETPFISGILETINLDVLLGQWRGELDRFVESEKKDVDAFITNQEADFKNWYNETTELMQNVADEIRAWSEAMKDIMLSDNVAATILAELSADEIERYLVSGLNDGETVISEDGRTMTTTDSAGRKLMKTFTSNFLTCTDTLIGTNGGILGRRIRDFSVDGLTINSSMEVLYDPSTTINN